MYEFATYTEPTTGYNEKTEKPHRKKCTHHATSILLYPSFEMHFFSTLDVPLFYCMNLILVTLLCIYVCVCVPKFWFGLVCSLSLSFVRFLCISFFLLLLLLVFGNAIIFFSDHCCHHVNMFTYKQRFRLNIYFYRGNSMGQEFFSSRFSSSIDTSKFERKIHSQCDSLRISKLKMQKSAIFFGNVQMRT